MIRGPIGPKVVPFWGSYVEFYKAIQKGTTLGPMGSGHVCALGPSRRFPGLWGFRIWVLWLSGFLTNRGI